MNARFPHPVPYAVALSLGIFAFLHIYNLVPSTESKLDLQKQLLVSDVDLLETGATVMLRWGNNFQKFDHTHAVMSSVTNLHLVSVILGARFDCGLKIDS